MGYYVPRLDMNEREFVIGKMGTVREFVKAHNILADCIEELNMKIDEVNAKLFNLMERTCEMSDKICYPIDECHEIHGTDCPAWKCSVCGNDFPKESNYCSNCGARVDKEKIKYIPDI